MSNVIFFQQIAMQEVHVRVINMHTWGAECFLFAGIEQQLGVSVEWMGTIYVCTPSTHAQNWICQYHRRPACSSKYILVEGLVSLVFLQWCLDHRSPGAGGWGYAARLHRKSCHHLRHSSGYYTVCETHLLCYAGGKHLYHFEWHLMDYFILEYKTIETYLHEQVLTWLYFTLLFPVTTQRSNYPIPS